MSTGYVKVYRSLCEKGYYHKSEYVHLWLHLLMRATYTAREFMFNGELFHLNPGQLLTGRHELSADTGICESTVERILKVFENGQQIEQQKTNRFRLITITNWGEYQQSEQQNGQQTDNTRTTDGQQTDTYNKDKKDNKEKKWKEYYDPSIPFSEIIEDLNQKRIEAGLPGGFRATTDATRKAICGRWADGYRLEDFRHVHAVKGAEWAVGEMAKHLTPATLYRPGNFEKYRNQTAEKTSEAEIEAWIKEQSA